MTYTGHVQNGVVVFDGPSTLPEGTVVRIETASPSTGIDELERIPTMYERYKSAIGTVEGLPEDFAENHDHYIHGTPKR